MLERKRCALLIFRGIHIYLLGKKFGKKSEKKTSPKHFELLQPCMKYSKCICFILNVLALHLCHAKYFYFLFKKNSGSSQNQL